MHERAFFLRSIELNPAFVPGTTEANSCWRWRRSNVCTPPVQKLSGPDEVECLRVARNPENPLQPSRGIPGTRPVDILPEKLVRVRSGWFVDDDDPPKTPSLPAMIAILLVVVSVTPMFLLATG
jgi:hypothetical protein